jgi:hypothetical protein
MSPWAASTSTSRQGAWPCSIGLSRGRVEADHHVSEGSDVGMPTSSGSCSGYDSTSVGPSTPRCAAFMRGDGLVVDQHDRHLTPGRAEFGAQRRQRAPHGFTPPEAAGLVEDLDRHGVTP